MRRRILACEIDRLTDLVEACFSRGVDGGEATATATATAADGLQTNNDVTHPKRSQKATVARLAISN